MRLLSLFFSPTTFNGKYNEGDVAKCSFQTQAGNMCIKKVSENRRLDGSR